MRDPGREDARLARPRAGEYEERAAGMADGSILVTDDGGKKIWRISYKGR